MHLAPAKQRFVTKRWRAGWRLLTVRSMPLTPAISVHITVAIAAVLLGPFAIWARKSQTVCTYIGACLVAGGFIFMPGRLMNQFMHQWLMSVV